MHHLNRGKQGTGELDNSNKATRERTKAEENTEEL